MSTSSLIVTDKLLKTLKDFPNSMFLKYKIYFKVIMLVFPAAGCSHLIILLMLAVEMRVVGIFFNVKLQSIAKSVISSPCSLQYRAACLQMFLRVRMLAGSVVGGERRGGGHT